MSGYSSPARTPGGSRNVLRDMSNSVGKTLGGLMASWATPTKPAAPAPQVTPQADDFGNAETPMQSWTSGDNFRFVEEDDDEVLFRVRDSGVLRSLALPCLPAANENADPGESIEDKQARVRAMRLSFLAEKPPTALPSLSEVLEANKQSDAASATKKLPPSAAKLAPSSAAKPPPILSDELWGELEEEVRRVSVGPVEPVNDEEDEGEDELEEHASFVSCPDVNDQTLDEFRSPADAFVASRGVQDAVQQGSPAIPQPVFEPKEEEVPAVVEEAAAVSEEAAPEPTAEELGEVTPVEQAGSEEESMTVAKLCEMGFSPEEAEWAVKQASTPSDIVEEIQATEEADAPAPESDAQVNASSCMEEEAAPAPVVDEEPVAEAPAVEEVAAAPAAEEAEATTEEAPAPAAVCIRRAGCTCVDCAEMAAMFSKPAMANSPPPAKEEVAEEAVVVEEAAEAEREGGKGDEHILSTLVVDAYINEADKGDETEVEVDASVHEDAPEASAPAQDDAEPEEPVESTAPEAAAPAESVAALVDPVEAPAPAAVCIRRAGCTCVDCAEMAAMFSKPAMANSPMSSPAKEEAEEEEVPVEEAKEEEQPPIEDAAPIKAAPEPELAVEDKQDESAEEPAAEEPVPEEADVAVVAEPDAELAEAPPAEEHVEEARPAEASDAEASEAAAELPLEEEHAAPAFVSNSPPCKPAVAAPVSAGGGPCIRRAGCTCADCSEMAAMFSKPAMANSPTASPAKEEVTEDKEEPVEEVREASPAVEEAPAPKSPTPAQEAVLDKENSPPPKDAADDALECTRKAGCLCPDCQELCGAALAPAAAFPKLRKKNSAKSSLVAKAAKGACLTPKKAAAATQQQAPWTPSPEKAPSPSKEEEAVEEAPEQPAFVSTSPPCKPAVAASVSAGGGPCIRRAGCTCADCSEMAAMFSKPAMANSPTGSLAKEELVEEVKDASPVKEEAPPAEEPAASAEEEANEEPAEQDKEAEDITENIPTLSVQDSFLMHEQEALEEAEMETDGGNVLAPEESKEEPAVVQDAFVSNSPPCKPAVAAPVSVGTDAVCIRRAGCTCVDCAEMAAMSSQSFKMGNSPTNSPAKAPEPAAESESAAPAEEAQNEEAPEAEAAALAEQEAAARAQEEAAALAEQEAAALAEAEAAALAEQEAATLAEEEAAAVRAEEEAASLAEEEAAAFAQEEAAAALAEEEAAALAASPKATPPEDSINVSAGNVVLTDKKHLLSPVPESPLIDVAPASVPALSITPAKVLSVTPARVASAGSTSSPDANAAALRDLMDMDDGAMLDISLIDDTLAGSPAAAPPAERAQEAKKEKVQWEISSDFEEVKDTMEAATPVAVAPAAGGRSRAMYTLEDVERIASFQKEAVESKLDKEKAELAAALAAAQAEAASVKEKLTSENIKLRAAMKEAELVVDTLAKTTQTERNQLLKVTKENADNKAYADELETAFNELHERYTKLKDYYTTADKKNVELTLSMSKTNELFKESQAQIVASQDRNRQLEERREAELNARDEKWKEEQKKLMAQMDEIRKEVEAEHEKLVQVEKDLANKDSELVQAKMHATLVQQQELEQRSKAEDIKVSHAMMEQQLKSKAILIAEMEGRIEGMTVELADLKSKAGEPVSASEQDVRLLRAQLQKAQLDKNAIQNQLKAKEADNAQLSAMCDELLQSMEASKSAA